MMTVETGAFFLNENGTLLQIGCADVFKIQTKQFVFHLF
jgi:hypothetical protein